MMRTKSLKWRAARAAHLLSSLGWLRSLYMAPASTRYLDRQRVPTRGTSRIVGARKFRVCTGRASVDVAFGVGHLARSVDLQTGISLSHHSRRLALAVAAVSAVLLGAADVSSAMPAEPIGRQVVDQASPAAFDVFLDRLMAAESGGRSAVKNPRSSALGPFQFINSTFLDITSRHFPAEIAGLSEAEILSLRTGRDLSRRAATVFCRENAKYLRGRGHEPTFAHLRLAFLLGATDAARILQAPQHTRVTDLLSPAVVEANPFMRAMNAGDLLEKSEHDLSEDRPLVVTEPPRERPSARPRPTLMQLIKEEKRALDCAMRGCPRLSALPKPATRGVKAERSGS